MTGHLRISPLVRSALFVSDLDVSAKFYADVLSLTRVYWEGELAGESLERLLGAAGGTRCRAKILQSGDVTFGMIGLFELTDPAPERVRKPAAGAHIGETCQVFYCSDLDEIMSRLNAGGYTVVCPPIPLVHEGRVKQREMTCADPDGIMINLIEWDPDAEARPELS